MQSLQQRPLLRGGSAWRASGKLTSSTSSRNGYARRALGEQHDDASSLPSVSTLTDPEAKFHCYGRHYGDRFELSLADLMASAPRVRGAFFWVLLVLFGASSRRCWKLRLDRAAADCRSATTLQLAARPTHCAAPNRAPLFPAVPPRRAPSNTRQQTKPTNNQATTQTHYHPSHL